MPLVRRTRATLRRAEFGFLGVVVYTRVHTPRRCGLPLSAAVLVLATLSWRPLRTSCWIVGMDRLLLPVVAGETRAGETRAGETRAGETRGAGARPTSRYGRRRPPPPGPEV